MSASLADSYAQITISEFPAASRYYYELLRFLEYHTDRNQQSISQQRRNARDKLTRLSKLQFQELSTDVYDEMSRRQLNNPEIPFLPVRDEFHPKRNQARQKLATLPKNRFHDLGADVFFELEVRFPVLLQVSQNFETLQHANNSSSPSLNHHNIDPASSSHTDPNNSASINFNNLDALMADLGNLMHGGSQMTNESSPGSEIDPAFRQEYESKISALTVALNLLQEKFNTQTKRLEELTVVNAELEAELRASKQNAARLQEECNANQRILRDSQSETSRLSTQLKSVMNENQVLKKQSINSNHSNHSQGDSRHHDNKLNAFKHAVNDLIQSIHSPQCTEVLMSMKKVVFACKTITEEVELLESDTSGKLSVYQRETVLSCKTDLTTALTTLMSAAKEHAGGVPNTNSAPEIERSANTLLDIMDRLASTVTLNCSPSSFPGPHARQEPSSSTSSSVMIDSSNRIVDLSSLQQFLENQTNQIVQAIQNLLISMRSNSFNMDFLNTVNQIDRVVQVLDDQCRHSFAQPFTSHFIRHQGLSILDQLLDSNAQLNQYARDISHDHTVKPSKQKVASASYEVAKYTKQLVGLVEQSG